MTVEPFDFGDGVPRRYPNPRPTTMVPDPAHNAGASTQQSARSTSSPNVTASQPRLFELDGKPSTDLSVANGASKPVRTGKWKDAPIANRRQAQADQPSTHTSAAGRPRTTVRGLSLILAVVGHAVIGSLIAAGGNLILGAVTSVAIMSCSAALVATEALANQ